nr:Trp biosynthesis-associated membrane protein [Actinoplanes consettensis]
MPDGAAGPVSGRPEGAAGPGKGRRLAYTVVLCAAGAGLALWGITRTWTVAVSTTGGLLDRKHEFDGSESAPLVLGLALVALAGAGALLATRGVARRVLGGLLVLAGAGIAVAAVEGRAGLSGSTGSATAWAVLCAAGGLVVVAGGWEALRHGHEWPGMGARYERSSKAVPVVDEKGTVNSRAAWDALDRGDDPT